MLQSETAAFVFLNVNPTAGFSFGQQAALQY